MDPAALVANPPRRCCHNYSRVAWQDSSSCRRRRLNCRRCLCVLGRRHGLHLPHWRFRGAATARLMLAAPRLLSARPRLLPAGQICDAIVRTHLQRWGCRSSKRSPSERCCLWHWYCRRRCSATLVLVNTAPDRLAEAPAGYKPQRAIKASFLVLLFSKPLQLFAG